MMVIELQQTINNNNFKERGMYMIELPQVINDINKKKKATKITTLTEAKAFILKRFFPGSFIVNRITGGGFAYRRIQLLFGAKSSGKNALLNQTIAYAQRLCRKCHNVLPSYALDKNIDRWSFFLLKVLEMDICKCSNPIAKKVLVLDYERSLSIEEPVKVKVLKITDIETDEVIDELDYNDALLEMNELTAKDKLVEEEKNRIKNIEQFLKNLKIEEATVIHEATTDYLRKCGIIINDLLVGDPEDTEEGIEYARDVIKSKEVDIVIWDSLQAALPRYVKDREADQATMGVEARQNGLLMRHVCSAFAATDLLDESEAYKAALFITSQVRAKMGYMSGYDTYSGGNAIQHHIAIALELKREHFLKENGEEAEFKQSFYGQRIRIRADKNKLSSPGGVYHLNYYFKQGNKFPVGIDHINELVELALISGYIEKKGAWYYINNEKFHGMVNLLNHYYSNFNEMKDLYNAAKEL